jgi:hypothetical protein
VSPFHCNSPRMGSLGTAYTNLLHCKRLLLHCSNEDYT